MGSKQDFRIKSTLLADWFGVFLYFQESANTVPNKFVDCTVFTFPYFIQ